MEREEDEMRPLVCGCGGRIFRAIVEQVVRELFILDGTIYGERSIEDEKFLEVVCVECGKTLVKDGEMVVR